MRKSGEYLTDVNNRTILCLFLHCFHEKAYIICYNASFGNKNTGIHIAYIMQCNKQDEKPRVGNF